jgi:hypothetical protein
VGVCIRCSHDLWRNEDEFCPSCHVATRLEYRRGLRELEKYLARWAEFSTWLEAAARG